MKFYLLTLFRGHCYLQRIGGVGPLRENRMNKRINLGAIMMCAAIGGVVAFCIMSAI